MTIHLFGNGPSPAVATYGLRRIVEEGEEFEPGAKEFVKRNFYVQDGLVSSPTATETIKLVRDTQVALATANLTLHKVVLNSVTVMEAFPTEDLAKDVHSLDLPHDELPAQRSLGVFWDLETYLPTRYWYRTGHSPDVEFYHWWTQFMTLWVWPHQSCWRVDYCFKN